jgi:hypothetical protein
MECQYKDICKQYHCKAKVFTKYKKNLECMIGSPELIVLFTNPVSHNMVNVAKKTATSNDITLIQSHCASSNALIDILEGVHNGR